MMCEAVTHQNEMDTAVCDMTCRRPDTAAEPVLVRTPMGTMRVWQAKVSRPVVVTRVIRSGPAPRPPVGFDFSRLIARIREIA